MKLYQLLELLSNDVVIRCYVNNNVIEGTRNDIKAYEEWLITDIRAEENVIAVKINID